MMSKNILEWRGIKFEEDRFKQNNCLISYTSIMGTCPLGLYPIILWRWNEKQWGAKVTGGHYSIANSMEEALTEAGINAISMMLADIDTIKILIQKNKYYSDNYEVWD